MAGSRAPGGGRKRKPTAQKRREGTLRADRANHLEPTPPEQQLPPARGLDPTEKRAWINIAEELHARGVLTSMDSCGMYLLVTARVRYERARRECLRKGEHAEQRRYSKGVLTSVTITRAPWSILRDRSFAEYRAMCIEFGLTPVARTRVEAKPVPSAQDRKKSKWAPRVVAG